MFRFIWDSDRIEVFDGDIEKPGLGLAEDVLSKIKSFVTIYIHAASTISLQRSLASISTSIVEPSLLMADIALCSPRMERFVYISTAYANAHLHNLHNGIDTFVSEQIYSLRPGSGDSTQLEHEDLHASSNTPEYQAHNFPFPYAYAKHLTERLLLRRFTSQNQASSLLILRPSIIGPALHEPYPYYENPGSAPATSFLAAVITTLSVRMAFASRFPDPYHESNIDEIPVDVVANRLLMHVSRRTAGIVHAVAGKGARRSFANLWTKAMSERRLPWCPRLVWHADVDWRDSSLHAVARIFVVLGTSFVFEGESTERLWERMTEAEKLVFPLWLQNLEQNGDVVMRRAGVSALVRRYFAKRNIPSSFIKLLVRDPVRAPFE